MSAGSPSVQQGFLEQPGQWHLRPHFGARHAQQIQPIGRDILQLAGADQLADRGFRPRRLPAGQGGHGPELGVFQAPAADIELRQLLLHRRVVDRRSVFHIHDAGDFQQFLEIRPGIFPGGIAFVHQRGDRHPPAGANRAKPLGVGDAHIVEIHLVEVRTAGHLLDRPDFHPWRLHVQEEEGQALMLRHVGVGAGNDDAPVAIMRAGGPDLLAIDHPVIAILYRAGPQRAEIGPAGRFGEQLAPEFLRLQRRRGKAVALFRRAPGADGGQAHAKADGEDAGQRLVLGFLLIEDHLLDLRAALAAPFLRPGNAGKAVIVFRPLVGARAGDGFRRILSAPVAGYLPRLAPGHGLVQERAGAGAKFGFFRAVVEIHGSLPLCRG